MSMFKQTEELKDELETLKLRYNAAKSVSDLYCGWVFAYRQTVAELHLSGRISDELKEEFYKKAAEFYEVWRTK